MRLLRSHCLHVLLLVLVAVTSVELAAARGQAPAVGTLVICTGSGPVHILVDENGQPTGGVMVCPDYALAFYADTTLAAPDVARADRWSPMWRSQTDRLVAEHHKPLSQPRGPPSFV